MNPLLKIFISFSVLTSTIFSVVFANNVCSLCNNGAYLSEKHTELYGKEVKEDNILFECENFYIAIDNYPVCDYHILIIPKEHKCSYSEIDINLEFELESIIKTLSNILETEEYGLFEHGSNFVGLEQKSCGNSINHAHMHFIPTLNLTPKNLINLCTSGKEKNLIKLYNNHELTNCFKQKESTQTFLNYIKNLPTKEPYLFCYFSNIKKDGICIPDNIIQNNVPSQFFRRIFAEYFQVKESKPFWNWKKTTEIERSKDLRTNIIKKIIATFKDKENFKKNFEKNLCEIKKK